MNALPSIRPSGAEVIEIERFLKPGKRLVQPTVAVVLVFPLSAQVDLVRRTASALRGASEARRDLTFRLWREGLNCQARRYGRSKSWATHQWVCFQGAVRHEIETQSCPVSTPTSYSASTT